jgi:alpha-2-macroglobulin
MEFKRALARLLMLTIFLTAVPMTHVRIAVAQENRETPNESTEEGLRFRLSEGSEPIEKLKPGSLAPATPLSDSETQSLLARLPAIKMDAGDTPDFKFPERSLPTPRAGQTIQAAFTQSAFSIPPNVPNTTAPLEVLRYAPEGEVALAPGLSVTFSQPMLTVSSQEEAAASIPITLTPQQRGRWRWSGTQTLVFQPEAEGGRLPMATNYTVTIPAGTKSALGNVLLQTRTITFATPPPTLKSTFPSGEGQPRDALIFLEFDQRIDAARVLEGIKLQPNTGGLRLRQATPEEVAADESIKDLVKQSQEGRWLVFRAIDSNGSTKDALPANTSIKIIIPPGTPSAEGPRTTTQEQSITFKTFGALRVTEAACGYDKRCSPFGQFRIAFSNQLDTENFQSSQVQVTPQIPDVKVSRYGNTINIEGVKRSNTNYTVTLDRSVKDRFGQTLSGNNQFSFKVTTADPGLFSTSDGFTVLDPAVKRTFNVYSVNYRRLKVRLYKVTPRDWQKFRLYQVALRYQKEKAPSPPGIIVFDKIIDLTSKPDELTETAIDLSPALTNGFGQVFVQVKPVEEKNAPVRVYAYSPDGRIEAWVQATDIGLDAFADKTSLVTWANSLHDGRPLEGVEIRVMADNITGKTDSNGLARLLFTATPESKGQNQTALIVARRGDDTAILPQAYNSYYGNDGGSWRRADSTESLGWYVFDDRKLYRPGEEVNIKGWIRKINLTPSGDTELFQAAGQSLKYLLKDSQGNEITKGSVKLNPLAGFNLKLQIPKTMNLGSADLEFELEEEGGGYTHHFQVQEFRRPEFEIKAEASEAPHFVGSSATATATATYYTGGGLANTEVSWTVTAVPTNYTPPNRDDYTFGKFYAWWRDGDYPISKEQTFTGKTNSEGRHALRMDFDGVRPARPSSVTAEARVQDVNRQTLAARTYMLVHPADVYVGLKSARTFVQKGESFDVWTIVTDLEGKALTGRDVKLQLVRLDYVYEKGEWIQKELDAQEQTVKSGSDGLRVSFPTKEGGAYRLTAQVRDERERPNESELSLWVAGGKLPPVREVEKEQIELIPDRKTYAGGEVAEILVQSPFAPAEGVLTLRRSGLLRTERFTMTESSYTLRMPLEEAMTPNVHVQVDLVGAATRVDDEGKARADLPKRTAFASGEIKLEIPPSTRRLNVIPAPRDAVLEPGAETIVNVEVKDAQGKAVQGTDTAVIVVDESVLALTRYRLDDPLSVFYPERNADVSDYHLREHVQLASTAVIEQLARTEGGAGAGGGGDGGAGPRQITELPLNGKNPLSIIALRPGTADVLNASTAEVSVMGGDDGSPIELRKNFNALAIFAASLPTDAQGRAQVRIKLPDNLTRYRVVAISVAGGKLAGGGESVITARKQLMVRPSAPRFLNFGDRAELPVVLQNQTNEAMKVDVAVRATNADLPEGSGRRVLVPANDRVEVRFPVVTVRPGMARFQTVTASGQLSDAAEVSLPVYTPATTEAFATYGVIDEGSIAQPVKAPADAIKSFGGLEVTTSSTQLQELTDAVLYLVNYPYECSEQIASRVIAISALKDVLTAFKAKGLPSPEAMRDSVVADIKRLQGLQNEDGGFDFWRRGERSVPFVSVHVAHSFVRAQSKGFIVPEEMMEKSRDYLRQIESKIPDDYSVESRNAIRAYALYVRALMKDRDAGSVRKLIAEAGGVEKLSMEALGWLLSVLSGDAASSAQVEAIRRHLHNRATETAGAAHFADSYGDGAYTILHSDRRADGVLLDALIGDQPQSDLIPKLVRGLLGGRKRGHWLNTQENVFILLALDRYFNTYEKQTPDFTARVWLGQIYAGDQAFKGRSVDRQQLNLPMSALMERAAAVPTNLTISKEGAGRLYFRIGAQYAPTNLRLSAADYGFRVERKYEAIDNPSDVRRDEGGAWHIKAGARVRVRLTMSNPARRYHVALVDPLPAGLEALNPELAVTEKLPDESTEAAIYRGGRGIYDFYWYWRGTWYEHQNLRDERAEAFASLLWEGEHVYSYFVRATTPGLFIVPPAKAEEMYSPETFGRGQSDRVRVE